MTETTEAQTQEPNPESFAALFEASATRTDQLREGDIVSGTILKVGKDSVVVDIGYKSEGVISLHEFINAEGNVAATAGDQVDVLIESKENEDGLVMLSKEKADKLKVWDEISAACERDELIEGTITQRVKGGLAVTIRGGVKAFLPGSQVDLRPVRNLDRLLDMQYQIEDILREKDYKIHYMLSSLLDACSDELEVLISENLEEEDLINKLRQHIEKLFGANDSRSEEILLDQFVEKQVQTLKPRFAHRKCRVETLTSAVPAIWIPRNVLAKIVEGLIRNAIENTPDSGNVTVIVRSGKIGPELEVSDTGIGIASDKQTLVFEPFYEVQDAINHMTSKTEFMGICHDVDRILLIQTVPIISFSYAASPSIQTAVSAAYPIGSSILCALLQFGWSFVFRSCGLFQILAGE